LSLFLGNARTFGRLPLLFLFAQPRQFRTLFLDALLLGLVGQCRGVELAQSGKAGNLGVDTLPSRSSMWPAIRSEPLDAERVWLPRRYTTRS
jgi:hypothetical protein